MKTITTETLKYLKALHKNNNREWFKKNRVEFDEQREHFISFCELLQERLEKHDDIESKKIYRIYRDVRFSKDKTPYSPHFSCHFTRASKARRGTYYFVVKPGESLLAGGFWGPISADLKRIRKEFELDSDPIRKIISKAAFKKNFDRLSGDELKTAPRGFAKDDPNIDLIRMKQFTVVREFTDKEVLDPSFMSELNKSFTAMRPFFDYMSDVLTTDLNGESII